MQRRLRRVTRDTRSRVALRFAALHQGYSGFVRDLDGNRVEVVVFLKRDTPSP